MKHVSDNLNYLISYEDTKTNKISSWLEDIEQQHHDTTIFYYNEIITNNMDYNHDLMKELKESVSQLSLEKKQPMIVKSEQKNTIVKAVKVILGDIKTFPKVDWGSLDN